MNTLSNVDNRRGGNVTSNVGFISNVLPKVQSQSAENSNTGVSSGFVPKTNHHWFVLRATYGRTAEASRALEEKHIEVYIPQGISIKVIEGKRKRIKQPLLPNLIFAYATRSQVEQLVKNPAPTSKYLKYYLDKIQPIESESGLHPPLIVPDKEMHNFILVTSIQNEHVMVVDPETCRYKSGDLVQIIDGEFKGVIGKVVRAAGQQRVAVHINGLCTIVTAYIPSSFLQKMQI